uniref:Uncharacterized protein n=1 Tax=Salix viminalis TaxID=40686 RepID=A0A6N2KIV4_SALVM
MLFSVGTEAYKNHFCLQGICRSVKKKKKNKSQTKVCSQNPTKPARFLCFAFESRLNSVSITENTQRYHLQLYFVIF